MWDVAAVGYKNDHHFTGAESFLHDDMTQQATAGFFTISRDAKFSANVFHLAHNVIIIFVLDQAGFHIDDAVTSPCVEAAHKTAFCNPNWHLCLIAVTPRLVHAECRANKNAICLSYSSAISRTIHDATIVSTIYLTLNSFILFALSAIPATSHPELPNPLQVVHHQLPFPRQLSSIVHMLQLAAAALVIDLARRCDAGAACFYYIQQFGVAILLFGLEHPCPDFLSGKGSLHKKGKAFYAAYPFTFMGHADNIEHNLIIFIHRQSGDRRLAGWAAGAASTAVFTHYL
ncbi:hypothetical protein D3C75_724790 [compost metagenome]